MKAWLLAALAATASGFGSIPGEPVRNPCANPDTCPPPQPRSALAPTAALQPAAFAPAVGHGVEVAVGAQGRLQGLPPDYHPRIGGGQEEVGGWGRGSHKLANACDSSDAGSPFHTYNGYGVNGDDYVDFIFTFEDANTWCGGYRQFGHANWGNPTFTKDIEIYTGDANFGPWTRVATDSHSTWHNGATPAFPDDGTTTEWTPTAPSKYLLVRTHTNHGDPQYGGRITVRFLQLKFAVWLN